MLAETYKRHTDEDLVFKLVEFIKETGKRNNDLVDFFGTSLSTIKRWRGEEQRIPHYAINLMEFNKLFNKMQKELTVENNEIREELENLRDYKERVVSIIRDSI